MPLEPTSCRHSVLLSRESLVFTHVAICQKSQLCDPVAPAGDTSYSLNDTFLQEEKWITHTIEPTVRNCTYLSDSTSTSQSLHDKTLFFLIST